MPRKKLIVLFAANAGDEGANLAVREPGEAMPKHFRAFD